MNTRLCSASKDRLNLVRNPPRVGHAKTQKTACPRWNISFLIYKQMEREFFKKRQNGKIKQNNNKRRKLQKVLILIKKLQMWSMVYTFFFFFFAQFIKAVLIKYTSTTAFSRPFGRRTHACAGVIRMHTARVQFLCF